MIRNIVNLFLLGVTLLKSPLVSNAKLTDEDVASTLKSLQSSRMLELTPTNETISKLAETLNRKLLVISRLPESEYSHNWKEKVTQELVYDVVKSLRSEGNLELTLSARTISKLTEKLKKKVEASRPLPKRGFAQNWNDKVTDEQVTEAVNSLLSEGNLELTLTAVTISKLTEKLNRRTQVSRRLPKREFAQNWNDKVTEEQITEVVNSLQSEGNIKFILTAETVSILTEILNGKTLGATLLPNKKIAPNRKEKVAEEQVTEAMESLKSEGNLKLTLTVETISKLTQTLNKKSQGAPLLPDIGFAPNWEEEVTERQVNEAVISLQSKGFLHFTLTAETILKLTKKLDHTPRQSSRITEEE